MDNAKHRALEKRFNKFIEELAEHNVSFKPMERTRLNKYFFGDKLQEEFSGDISKASFEELIGSMDGCGIAPIERYLEEPSKAPVAPAENKTMQKEEDSPAIVEKTAGIPVQQNPASPETVSESAKEEPEIIRQEAGTEPSEAMEIGTAKQDPLSIQKNEEPKPERKAKKQTMTAADYLSLGKTQITSQSREAKERITSIKRQLLNLKRQREITTERVSIYRTDLLLFQSIVDFSKKSQKPVIINGIEVTDTCSLMNAAMSLVAADLAESKKTDIFEHTKRAAGAIDVKTKEIDEKMKKLREELDQLQG